MLSKDKKRGDAMIKADSAKRYNQLAVELLKKHLMGIIGWGIDFHQQGNWQNRQG